MMASVAAGASIAVLPWIRPGAARGLLGDGSSVDSLALPGQIGDATPYVTATGTPCWQVAAYAGTPDNYRYVLCLLPQSLDIATATPTVMAMHGLTALETQIVGTLNSRGVRTGVAGLVDSWLDRGWAVVAPRMGSDVKINPTTGKKTGINFPCGNAESRLGLLDVHRWMQAAWTPDPRGLLVLSQSMGTVAALNHAIAARAESLPLAAVYSVDGATNLAYLRTRGTAAIKKAIRNAYRLSNTCVAGDPEWIAKVGGHDPQNVEADQYSVMAIRLAASGNDPTVNKVNNSVLWHNTFSPTWPAECSRRDYAGGHCASGHFNVADVNGFFTRALEFVPATTTTTAPEAMPE